MIPNRSDNEPPRPYRLPVGAVPGNEHVSAELGRAGYVDRRGVVASTARRFGKSPTPTCRVGGRKNSCRWPGTQQTNGCGHLLESGKRQPAKIQIFHRRQTSPVRKRPVKASFIYPLGREGVIELVWDATYNAWIWYDGRAYIHEFA